MLQFGSNPIIELITPTLNFASLFRGKNRKKKAQKWSIFTYLCTGLHHLAFSYDVVCHYHKRWVSLWFWIGRRNMLDFDLSLNLSTHYSWVVHCPIIKLIFSFYPSGEMLTTIYSSIFCFRLKIIHPVWISPSSTIPVEMAEDMRLTLV